MATGRPPGQHDEHRPAHPTGRAIALMVLVVVFLVLMVVTMSVSSSGR